MFWCLLCPDLDVVYQVVKVGSDGVEVDLVKSYNNKHLSGSSSTISPVSVRDSLVFLEVARFGTSASVAKNCTYPLYFATLLACMMLPAGVCVLCGGHTCGQTDTCHVYVHFIPLVVISTIFILILFTLCEIFVCFTAEVLRSKTF